MIPTLLLLGLVLGKWWRVVIPAATIGWAVLLVAMDVGSGFAFAADAAAFGFINVSVGVLLFQAIRLLLHGVVRDRRKARDGGAGPVRGSVIRRL